MGPGDGCANLTRPPVVKYEIPDGQGRKPRVHGSRFAVRGSQFTVGTVAGRMKRTGLMGHMGPMGMYRASQNVQRTANRKP
jgi:hypothetical protein